MAFLAIYLAGVVIAALAHWRFGDDVWSDMTWTGRALFAFAWPFVLAFIAFAFFRSFTIDWRG